MTLRFEAVGVVVLVAMWLVGFVTGFLAAHGPREWREVARRWREWRFIASPENTEAEVAHQKQAARRRAAIRRGANA